MSETQYQWTDNPTESGIALCDTDVLNECLMHLKYDNANSSRNIGEIITSTIPLTDAGLHLLDGALIQGSGIYSDFIDYIADLVTDYPDLFCTEAQWRQSVTTYGVCGKFVYDSVNNTVRLPKITGFVEGTTDVTALGDLVEAGLPNITATWGSTYEGVNAGWTSSGAVSSSISSDYDMEIPNVAANGRVVRDFNASRSSSIYGNSSTVQPQSIKVLYYIVVATSTKTDIEVDIDEIATDLNGKADVDLSNLTNTGKTYITKMGLPSTSFVHLTIGADGTSYTAPADGFVSAIFTQSTQARSYLDLITVENGSTILYPRVVSETPGDYLGCWIPVRKGQSFALNHLGFNISNNTCFLVFIYAQGSESEAS